MADTLIEWATKVWNVLRGCSRISPGCGGLDEGGCYAERQAHRFSGPGGPYEGLTRMTSHGPRWTGKVNFIEEKLLEPLSWKKPQKIFVNSMSDLFHESVPDEQIDEIFWVMSQCQRHTFQILTKRPERMLEWFRTLKKRRPIEGRGVCTGGAPFCYCPSDSCETHDADVGYCASPWPLPNVWLGTSCEDQKTADKRIPLLLETPAAVRWVSAEPLLGPIDLTRLRNNWDGAVDMVIDSLAGLTVAAWHGRESVPRQDIGVKLDWCVVGGESGPGARPCNVQWILDIVRQCQAAGVKVFVKQLGARPVRIDETTDIRGPVTMRLILQNKKGGDITEFPFCLQVREFPEVANA